MNRLSPQNPQMLHPNPPKVSIVLPTYNGSKYIRKSIQSIIDQTFNDWELIVVDDCSSDDTSEIIKSFNDNRIVYTRNGVNCKLPRSLNRGFVLATGEYLTWTSDDNFYKVDAIEKMVNALENNPNVDIVCAYSHFINDNNDVSGDFILSPPIYVFERNTVGACFLFRRNVYLNVGAYDPDLLLIEDYDYWLRACKKFRACQIKEFLYYYRLHETSLTGQSGADNIAIMAAKHGKKSSTKTHAINLFIYRVLYRFAHPPQKDRFAWVPKPIVNILKFFYSFYERKMYV